MTIVEFFQLCNAHPWAYIALIVNLGVVFVNGWTDGPNSIATAVTTRAMRPKPAVIMCAVLNAAGVVVIGAFSQYISALVGCDISLLDTKTSSSDPNDEMFTTSSSSSSSSSSESESSSSSSGSDITDEELNDPNMALQSSDEYLNFWNPSTELRIDINMSSEAANFMNEYQSNHDVSTYHDYYVPCNVSITIYCTAKTF